MQIVEYSLLHWRAQAESPLSQGSWPVFVKTWYTPSVPAQTHLPKFPETSLKTEKERCNQSYPWFICLKPKVVNSGQLSTGLWSYPHKQNRIYDSIWLQR